MIIDINKEQAEAIVEYFEWEFLPYIQDKDNEVDNVAWVADKLNFYQQVKKLLQQEKLVDKQQDVCYNDITVKEYDNSSTDSVSDELKVCSCYDDRQRYDGRRGICLGTRECDPCNCGGDVRRCDFYPEKRG